MRNEFSRKTKAQAFERSKGLCENKACGIKLFPGKIAYDHVNPDWTSGDNSLENCEVLCLDCHKAKTALDQGDIAKVKRIRDKHIGAMKSRSVMPGSKRSGWKKTFSRGWVRR